MAQPKIQTPNSIVTHSQPLVENANNLIEQAERAVVTTPEEFASAADFVKICQGQIKLSEEARTSLTGPLNDHIKWINDQFRPIKTAIEKAKKIVSDKAATWKRAEDKRIREEAEAERIRLEEEALREAEKASEAGDDERADALLDVASTTPAAPVTAPAARGTITGAVGSTRTNWKGHVEFDNTRTVCQAIADGKLPVNIIKDWNKTVMNQIAKQIGANWDDNQETGTHHGLTIKKDVGLAVR